jgi:hypothetical protein
MNKNINKYLDIKKNEVLAKVPCEIIINVEEYKNIEEELASFAEEGETQKTISKDEEELKEELVITVPGFFEIIFPDEMDSIKFSLPYKVQLFKTNILKQSSKLIHLNFEPGDRIFQASFKNPQSDIRVLNTLMENGVKYLNNDIYQTIIAIYNQFKTMSSIPFSHIELMVSQLFSTSVNGEMVPLRLTGKEYKKEYAIGTKKSAHQFGSTTGFSYGYTNDYLLNDLSKSKRKENTYFENIISGDYEKLNDTNKEGRI